MSSLKKQIETVKFRCRIPRTSDKQSGWHNYPTSEIETQKLAVKARYHMKQLLACLWELKKRDIDVCKHLSKNITEYKSCHIKYTNGELSFFTRLKGR